ncbi:CD48 antigen-like isoform X2 [Oncorhynchus keta]|uniref:CD48 antigen-like isoform X2 n=1 Tax=Oncorhynchus keta TaxID=8018 RepID=UPI0015FBCED2|nr:CD48 antigen-like isoform X2 [Oncorhynchus keta]
MKTLFLLHICWLEIITGIRGEPSVDQYGLKGGSICLAVAEPEILKGLKWKTDSDIIVDDKEISPKYKEKVDYNSVNHSLCIKNLLNTDSRMYIISAINQRDWTYSATTYRLKVLDHVPKPVMDVTSLFNTSVGLCDVTVNCSVKDGWMLSVCGWGQCTLSQQLMSLCEVNIIIISNGNGTIQCSSSNHVSTQTIYQPMEDCIGEKDAKASALSVRTIAANIVRSVIVCVGLAVTIMAINKIKRWISSKEDDSTQVIVDDPLGPSEVQTLQKCAETRTATPN